MTKPEIETDPWKAIQRYEFVQTNFAYTTDHEMERDAEGEWARWEAVDAARAAEAAQHRREVAALEHEAEHEHAVATAREGYVKTLEAERDRLKAALATLVEAIDIEGEGTHYNGVIMHCYENARAALTTQGQSTDGETR